MRQKNQEINQIDRFKDSAHALGADESEAAFDQVLREVEAAQPPRRRGKARHVKPAKKRRYG